VLIGFSRKLSAPSRVARTAVSMVACPLIMTTGVSFFAVRKVWRSVRPSPSGSCTSKRHRSYERFLILSSATFIPPATSTA